MMSASSASPLQSGHSLASRLPSGYKPCPFFAAGWLPCISSSRTGSCPSRRTHGRDHYPGVHRVSRRLCGDPLLFDSKRKRAAGPPPPDLPCSLPRAHTHMQTKTCALAHITKSTLVYCLHPHPTTTIAHGDHPPPALAL